MYEIKKLDQLKEHAVMMLATAECKAEEFLKEMKGGNYTNAASCLLILEQAFKEGYWCVDYIDLIIKGKDPCQKGTFKL